MNLLGEGDEDRPSSSSWSASPTTKDQTYARTQFIALGVGVIVGRCGRSSPASALTPSSLSLIGRDWIVFPARVVVAEVGCHDTSNLLVNPNTKEYIKISVSPTLGLVRDPTIVSFGIHKVTRFALTIAEPPHGYGTKNLSVIDTSGCVEELKLTMWTCVWGSAWCSNRRWVAVAKNSRNKNTLSLWNFDGIEAGVVRGVEGVVLPWAGYRATFRGDSSLVLSSWDSGLIIDLDATLALKTLVGSPLPFTANNRKFLIDHIVLWEGIDYAVLHGENLILCLNTGELIPMMPLSWDPRPIGGPYEALVSFSTGTSSIIEVISVLDPTKVCCTHRELGSEKLHFGHEIVLLDTTVSPLCQPNSNTIKVIDAVSGFLVCKMIVKGVSVQEVS
ncbi:hypothetical protein Pelo_7219 [Pelomyxa schiedti]|nr:hypothetical protein Pelo_7219 [Pelomyxa schiedti]